MRIQLKDGRQVEVAFAYKTGNEDPRIRAVQEQRKVLYRSHRDPLTYTVYDSEITEQIKALDSVVGALRKGRHRTINCQVTVIMAETIESTREVTLDIDKIDKKTGKRLFATVEDCRREALIYCLDQLWPTEVDSYHPLFNRDRQSYWNQKLGKFVTQVSAHRTFRKQVWDALLGAGFKPIHTAKMMRVSKVRDKLRELQSTRELLKQAAAGIFEIQELAEQQVTPPVPERVD
jgi:hypothetical protein